MIAATNVELGRSVADGSSVHYGTEMGPLMIFGDYAAGKTVAARSIFEQLISAGEQNNNKMVIVIDGSHQGYREVAEANGGKSITLGSDEEAAQLALYAAEQGNTSAAPSIISIDASALTHGSDYNQAAAEHLANLLFAYGNKDPHFHLIADPVDALLKYEKLASMLHGAWRTTRPTDSISVAVFSEPKAFRHVPEGSADLLRSMGSTLLVGKASARLKRSLDLPGGPVDPVIAEVARASNLSTGGAILYSRGGITTLTVDPLHRGEEGPQ